MIKLDTAGQQRLHALQARHGSTYYQVVPPQRGTDPDGRVSLTVDAAARVTDVSVDKVEELRTPDRLAAAFDDAWLAADNLRALASAEQAADHEALVERGRAVLEGRLRVTAPAPRPVRPGAAADQRARPPAVPGRAGSAAHGYLDVSLPGGGFGRMRVTADGPWLTQVSRQVLERSLREALLDAGEVLW